MHVPFVILWCGLLLVGDVFNRGLATPQIESTPRGGFMRPTFYPSGGTSAWFVSAADVTADGAPDLILINKESATLATFAGNGDGSFRQAVTSGAGADPRRVVVADLNEDKIPDLISIGYFDNGFTVRLGTGDGAYQPGAFHGLNGHGKMLEVADFNADGHLDVVATSDGSGQPIIVYVFLGNGRGELTAAQTYPTTIYNATDIDVADMDGDSKSDVILATADPAGHVLIFSGTGDGAFAPPVALPPLIIPPALNDGTSQLLCADVNNDGRPDVIVSHNDSNPEMVSVRLNRGNFVFDLVSTLPTPFPTDLASGDINRDGKPDLVIANYGANTVSYSINSGDGFFQTPIALSVGDKPKSVALADFNRDGWLDIAVANSGDHSLSVSLNTGKPRPRSPIQR
jgi:hypothetical protein